jgi:hypothetical protein
MALNRNEAVNKWFRIFSPCFIATLLSLGGIILCFLYLRSTEGWSALGIPVFLLSSAVCFVADSMLKHVITTTIKLWIVQLITLSAGILLLYIFNLV